MEKYTAAQDLTVGNEIEMGEDLYTITFIEEAEQTDGNDEKMINLYLEGVVFSVPVFRTRQFLTF